MGIYNDNTIYGIRIYKLNDADDTIEEICYTILYECKYNIRISNIQLDEAILFYENLQDKNNIYIDIYTECSTTYEPGNFMMWIRADINNLLIPNK